MEFKPRNKTKVPVPSELDEQLRKGKKFVVINDDINEDDLPEDLYVVNLTFPDTSSYRAVVPKRVLAYVGDKNNFDELFDFYQEILEHEKKLMKERSVEPGTSYFAQKTRDALEVSMINELVSFGGFYGETPIMKDEYIQKYEKDPEVSGLIEKLVKTYTGLDSAEKADLRSVLHHVNKKVEIQTEKRVYCDMGSHWDWKTVTSKKDATFTEEKMKSVGDLENEILGKIYNEPSSGKELARKKDELRTYVNLKYLSKNGNQMPLIVTEKGGQNAKNEE